MESQEIGLSPICFGSSLDETLPLSPNTCCHSHPTLPADAPLFASHYGGMLRRTSCLYVSWQVSLRDAETLEPDVSKVLHKVAACTTPAAASEPQHPANGGSNLPRSCRVSLNFLATPIHHFYNKNAAREDGWKRRLANEQKVDDDKYLNIYQIF